MRFRKLRIAWSVWWGIVAVLLCVLWVCSYTTATSTQMLITPRTRYYLHSTAGTVAIQRWRREFIGVEAIPIFDATGLSWLTTNAGIKVSRSTSYGIAALSVSYWLLNVVIAIIAAIPWLPFKRFSLRTLLIATTIVAVVLGLIVWLR